MCPFIKTDRQTDGQKDIKSRLKDKLKEEKMGDSIVTDRERKIIL